MVDESGHTKILVIEDNPGDFILIDDFLREEIEQVEVVNATSLALSKKLLAETPDFSAVLLDLTLPDCSGEKLVEEMINLKLNCPIIVLTGFTNKEFGIRTLSMGISDYLMKDNLSAPQLYKSITYGIERKRINLQLRESEEKYRNLFDMNPMPMWVYDIETLKFLNINEAAIRHYGFSREEFLNMTLKEIRPTEDIKLLERSIVENENSYEFNHGIYRHQRKNGEIFDVEIQSNRIYFEGKKGRLVLATDVSERMEYIRAIEDQNRVMREIAWTQSHVVRAPLARIMGLVNLINSTQFQEDSNLILNFIQNSAHELDEIVREIVRKTEKVEKTINK